MFNLLGIVFVIGAAAAAQEAVVVITGNATGIVRFTETQNGVQVTGQVSGLTPGRHGFHIHALGDLSNGCTSAGPHFNPQNQTHGAPNATVRHAGDLGNIEADANGIANISLIDKALCLTGEHSIIGRAVVVHAQEDDLGQGGNDESLRTGNAGGRVGCGVIGRLSLHPSSADKLHAKALIFLLGLTIITWFIKS
ncbi:superoxide dismutase [Cu-Zn] [Agrilus planipennis]|uniref:Superoxide dismutase [Cu-Zn] n=1 Tax=Agrilus planipennis TaxID=224129 RepID=A0A7F5R7Z4_AGRPL|nr:superoxide dismutase [Cu-Zn] [Agrilus planipennis]XP_025832080.1 superoxide dismutase [Cu-Zn] [Agrilus planipennis]